MRIKTIYGESHVYTLAPTEEIANKNNQNCELFQAKFYKLVNGASGAQVFLASDICYWCERRMTSQCEF